MSTIGSLTQTESEMSGSIHGFDDGAWDRNAPAGGPPGVRGSAGLYGSRLRQLGLLSVDDLQAETFWREVSHHRRSMSDRMGRDVGQRVALLDYIVNLQPQLLAPQVIEETAVGATQTPSIVDGLTGLPSRYFFELELVRETERSGRYGSSVSLVMLDLDGFQAINERHGRAVGDEVLQAVAALILHHVRAPDVPCRYGADEFALILTGSPQVEALTVAQRVCGDISEWFQRNPLGHGQVRVSASAGVASLPMDDSSMELLVQEAGSALREAKRLGGYRVIAPIGGGRSRG